MRGEALEVCVRAWERPICECHGEPMYSAGGSPKSGGPPYWKCAVACRDEWRERYEADPEHHKSRVKAWREQNPSKAKVNAMNGRLFLTVDRYEQMLEECGGTCMICGTPPGKRKRGWRTLCVDHDHETGVVRGLLCRRCNTGIGMFGDDPVLVAKALLYLEEARR